MVTTIDAAGRLVIPKAIRQEAEIEPGMELDVRVRHGVIEIQARPIEVTLVRKGRMLVARPKKPVPPLTQQIVNRTLNRLRNERGK